MRRRTFTAFCQANGCVWLRTGLGRHEAARAAQSHAKVAGHPTGTVEETPKGHDPAADK